MNARNRHLERSLIFSTASLWLLLNAIYFLDVNYDLPFGFDRVRLWEEYTIWPWFFLIIALSIRQVAQSWFEHNRGHTDVDRLSIGWFVFIGTMGCVDWFEPTMVLEWPMLIMDTTFSLIGFYLAGIVQTLHQKKIRKHVRKTIR